MFAITLIGYIFILQCILFALSLSFSVLLSSLIFLCIMFYVLFVLLQTEKKCYAFDCVSIDRLSSILVFYKEQKKKKNLKARNYHTHTYTHSFIENIQRLFFCFLLQEEVYKGKRAEKYIKKEEK